MRAHFVFADIMVLRDGASIIELSMASSPLLKPESMIALILKSSPITVKCSTPRRILISLFNELDILRKIPTSKDIYEGTYVFDTGKGT